MITVIDFLRNDRSHVLKFLFLVHKVTRVYLINQIDYVYKLIANIYDINPT